MRIQPGDVVVRHDQPDQQGTVANVTGVIIFVHWHGRSPSYEHARDLLAVQPRPAANKKGRPK